MIRRTLALLEVFGVPRWQVFIAVSFALIAPSVLIALGVFALLDIHRFAAGAVPVEAEVVRYVEVEEDEGTIRRPLMGFTTPDGAPAEALLHYSDSARRVAGEGPFTLLYNPDRPEMVRLPGWPNLYLWAGLFTALAVAGGVAAVLGLLYMLRWFRQFPAHLSPEAFRTRTSTRAERAARMQALKDRMRDRRR